ncbi:relaxase/mobilization nuclease domain-containing protein [Macrococcoides caseolyticum]|uniref:relaxase/mobilization nuclease domain-containing protein n=1 Tax=Macrococcoides caseolyticum TaxID=69966 RepID=UPI0024BD38A9|nr:relaxase/mobilization nuclease domain-containing protein [Macrococcus caseolyticus]MDJ1089981.1 relaxase/mobilization nuclease domain-containing protein [Macrococcus caseolyticus]
MATTKLGNTRVAARSISYAEKKAVVKSSINCDIDNVRASFRAVREIYGKNDGVQAHTIIQSFKPGEVTAEQANALGRELAERVAKGHQVAIYTHDDTEHIHNHIVINSVADETGKKYQINAKKRHEIKDTNDEICRENGLSIVEKKQEIRKTQAEIELEKKGLVTWKQEIREVVEEAKEKAKNKDEFVEKLKENHIGFKETNKTVTYLHSNGQKIRGKRLGNLYDKEEIELSLERNKNRVVEEEKEIKRGGFVAPAQIEEQRKKAFDPILQEQLERFKKKHGIKQNGDFREPLIYREEEQKLALLGAVSKNHTSGHAERLYGSEYGYKVFINECEVAFEGRINSNSSMKFLDQLRVSAKENNVSDVFERSLEDMRALNKQRQTQQRMR